MPLSAPRLCELREFLGAYVTHHLRAVYAAADADLRAELGDLYAIATPAQIHAFICELVAFHIDGGVYFEGPFETPTAWQLTNPDIGLDITSFLIIHGCFPD